MKLPAYRYATRVDEERKRTLAALEEKLGHRFADKEVLNRALSHKSYTNERGLDHNEQSEKLEFLGDGVLGLVLNEILFRRFPEHEEGYLARIKSAVASETVLAEIARNLELGKYVLLGRGEEHAGGRERAALLADTLEAVIGALYIDGGFPAARKFIRRHLAAVIDAVASGKAHKDYKSLFQEWAQKERKVRPVYRVAKAKGPEHSKEFHVEVLLENEVIAAGSGRSKKDAEQDAAEKAYRKLVEKKPDRRSRKRRRCGERRKTAAAKEAKDAPRPKTRAGAARKDRRDGREEKEEDEALLPPPDVEDILAWAVGERPASD